MSTHIPTTPIWMRAAGHEPNGYGSCREGDVGAFRVVPAAELDRLRAEVEVLRASVLEEAAKAAEGELLNADLRHDPCDLWYDIGIKDAVKAIRALSGPKGQGSGEA